MRCSSRTSWANRRKGDIPHFGVTFANSSAVPVRAADNAAEIAAVEVRLLVRDDVGLHVAKGRVRLVPDAVVEGLDDVFLELRRAREGLHHGLALVVGVFLVG